MRYKCHVEVMSAHYHITPIFRLDPPASRNFCRCDSDMVIKILQFLLSLISQTENIFKKTSSPDWGVG